VPKFIIDNCITIEAESLEEASNLSDKLRETITTVASVQRQRGGARSAFARIENLHVCHVEQIPEEQFGEELVGLSVAS
jgi:hypothetical protein